MSAELAAARAAMRARQGAGARFDAASAPADDLDLARRGTAYFARLLNGLDDEALGLPAARGGSRADVVAEIGVAARAMAVSLAAVRDGAVGPVDDPSGHAVRIALAETLPRHALRYLVRHAALHLDVEWRDLTDAGWGGEIVLPDGARLALRDTPIHRARAVWSAALDLDAGGRAQDLPARLQA